MPRPLALLLIALAAGCHSPRRQDAGRFTSELHRVELAGRRVAVDFYLPVRQPQAPIVIIAHGFAASRKNMAGWGERLAQAGFIVVIPDMPYFSDHARNAEGLVQLVDQIRQRRLPGLDADPERIALVGFSAGGLETLLATLASPAVSCWVGLDPVDYDGMGQKAAPRRAFPALLLRAEPSKCNQHGNARTWPDVLPGSTRVVQIPNATHCDIEDPAAYICRFACGERDPDRHHRFVAYTLNFLRSNLR